MLSEGSCLPAGRAVMSPGAANIWESNIVLAVVECCCCRRKKERAVVSPGAANIGAGHDVDAMADVDADVVDVVVMRKEGGDEPWHCQYRGRI